MAGVTTDELNNVETNVVRSLEHVQGNIVRSLEHVQSNILNTKPKGPNNDPFRVDDIEFSPSIYNDLPDMYEGLDQNMIDKIEKVVNNMNMDELCAQMTWNHLGPGTNYPQAQSYPGWIPLSFSADKIKDSDQKLYIFQNKDVDGNETESENVFYGWNPSQKRFETSMGLHHANNMFYASDGASTFSTELSSQSIIDGMKFTYNNNQTIYLSGADVIHGACSGSVIYGPCANSLGCTFNNDLIEKSTDIYRQQSRLLGINLVYAPMCCQKSHPGWGRFHGALSESNEVTAQMAKALTKGYHGGDHFQKGRSLAVTTKHVGGYAPGINAGEDRSNVLQGNKYMREKDLLCYAGSLSEKPLMLMTNPGAVNSTSINASYDFVTKIVRTRMQFNGAIMSDWADIQKISTAHSMADENWSNNSANDLGESEILRIIINAGVDMLMTPPNQWSLNAKDLVNRGKLQRGQFERAVKRLMVVKAKLGLLEDNWEELTIDKPPEGVTLEDYLLGEDRTGKLGREEILETTLESIVLLKNEDNTLPLNKSGQKVLVSGPCADNANALLGSWTYAWQGIVNSNKLDGGDKHAKDYDGNDLYNPPYVTPLDGAYGKSKGMDGIFPTDMEVINAVKYLNNDDAGVEPYSYYYTEGTDIESLPNGQRPKLVYSDIEIDEIAEQAENADYMFLFIGEPSSYDEGQGAANNIYGNIQGGNGGNYSKMLEQNSGLSLQNNQKKLIQKCRNANPDGKLVLVHIGGRPLLMNEEINMADAFIFGGLGSSYLGQALWHIITGNVQPSGALSFSWPRIDSQLGITFNNYTSDELTWGPAGTWDFQYKFGHLQTYNHVFLDNPKAHLIDSNLVEILVDVTNTGNSDQKYPVIVYSYLFNNKEMRSTTHPGRVIAYTKVNIPSNTTKNVKFHVKLSNFCMVAGDILEQDDGIMKVPAVDFYLMFNNSTFLRQTPSLGWKPAATASEVTDTLPLGCKFTNTQDQSYDFYVNGDLSPVNIIIS